MHLKHLDLDQGDPSWIIRRGSRMVFFNVFKFLVLQHCSALN